MGGIGAAVQGCWPFCVRVTSRGGRGRGGGAASLTLARGGALCPGDMMIDRGPRLRGMRPLSLYQAVRLARGGGQRLTAAWREQAAVVPIG